MSVNNERTEGDASSYNATLDPRTGRPPTPLEAERLKAEKLVDKALDEYLEDNGMKEGAAEPDGTGVGPEHEPAAMAGPDGGESDGTKTYFDNKGNEVPAPNDKGMDG